MSDSVTSQPRIALLIDADNAPAELIDEILTELSTLGVINIRRAYGNWTKHGLNGWQERLLEFAIRPMQQFDYSKGKNASDMAMTVDAMELLYTERPDAYGIVSSDADFTPLVMHLRAKGAEVYGFGMAQTPKPFVNACSRFLYLEALAEAHASSVNGDAPGDADGGGIPAHLLAPADQGTAPMDAAPSAATRVATPPVARAAPASQGGAPMAAANAPQRLRVATSKLRQDTALMNLLRDAAAAVQDESGWARVGAVGTQISNKASFDARNYGYATLTKLLAATDAFDFRDEGTSRVAVRDKRAAARSA